MDPSLATILRRYAASGVLNDTAVTVLAEAADELDKRHALLKAGDKLQSEASRMAEFLREVDRGRNSLHQGSVPYEVQMSALEAQSAVDKWTKARTR